MTAQFAHTLNHYFAIECIVGFRGWAITPKYITLVGNLLDLSLGAFINASSADSCAPGGKIFDLLHLDVQ
jgi:hypothetical protein